MKENSLEHNIKKLLCLKKDSRFIVNGKYHCTIENDNPFFIFEKDMNCPTYSTYAVIKVDEKPMLSKISVSFNIDLNLMLSSNICFYDNGKDLSSLNTVTDIKFI